MIGRNFAVLVTAFVLMISGIVGSSPAQAEDFLIAYAGQMPDREVRTIGGEVINLAATGAEVTIVHIFACDSKVCGESVPALEEHVWRPMRDKGVIVIGIGRDATKEQLEAFASEKSITFPLVADPDRAIAALFSEEGKGVPRTIVTTNEGKVAYRHAGYTGGRDAEFRRVADDLLGGFVPTEFATCGGPSWHARQVSGDSPFGGEGGNWVGKQLPAGEHVKKWINKPAGSSSGKYQLVEFWATWCGPCIMVMPEIQAKHEKYGSRVAIMSISDEDPQTVKRFVEARGFTYPIGVDQTGALKNTIGVRGIPHALLVNPEGEIIWEGHPAEFMGEDGHRRFEGLIGWPGN
jgi:peroxiredoxin